MATAFNGIQLISDIGAKAPDFGMMTKAAASVQGRYLEGFNRYKSTINSLLNAKIRSEDNINFRSNYFKKIDEYLNNLKGVDFSNPANVEVASTLMDPLVKDKEFAYDLNSSMMQDAERGKMEQARTSTDEKIRSQYSPTMDNAMSYNDQDMRNAKRGDGSIFKVGVQRYVPFTNINNALEEAAAKQKLEIKVDHLSGVYILTDTNGDLAKVNFTQWARQQLGNTYDEQLLVTGKVDTRRQLDSMMQADPALTRDAAFQKIAKEKSAGIYANYTEYEKSLNDGVATIDKELASMRTKYKNKIPKGSQDEQTYSQLKQVKEQYQKELSDSRFNKSDKDKELQTAFQQFMNNPEYALLPGMKDSIAKGWATSYANAKMSREIKVNQYALQKDAQAWGKFMSDYTFQQDLKKMQFQAGLDFELEAAKGTLAGGTVSAGGQELTSKPDAYSLYEQDQRNLLNETIRGYFDENVLAAAANTPPGQLKYAQLSSALTDVLNNFSKYSGSKFDAAPDTYKTNYQEVVNYLRKINPNLNGISNVGQIMKVISSGVANYRGDHTLWTKANASLERGSTSFAQWAEMRNEKEKNFANWKNTWNSTDYWDIDPNTGAKTPRADLDDAEREAMYGAVIPNYQSRYKNRTAQTNTMFSWTGDPKKFNYGAIDEVIQKAQYITGTSDAEKLSSEEAERIRNEFAQAGGNLADIFNPSNMYAVKSSIGGKDYIKVVIPVNSTKKGEKLVKGTTGQAISFYIPPEQASSLWQSKTTYNYMGKTIEKPTYGSLANVPQMAYYSDKPVNWIVDGLTTRGVAPFPDWMKTYGIQDGYLMFDQVQNKLRLVVKTNNQEREYPLGVDYNTFISNPSGQSQTIMRAIEQGLGKIKDAYSTSMVEQQTNHDINVMQFPENYINADDIA